MKEMNLAEIERINVAILVLGSILAMVVMREFRYLFSFAVGSAIVTLNFRFLRKILEGGLLQSSVNKKSLAIKLPLKFMVLVALIVIVVVWGDVNIVFFLTGLSTVFLSLIISQFSAVFSPFAKRRQNDGP